MLFIALYQCINTSITFVQQRNESPKDAGQLSQRNTLLHKRNYKKLIICVIHIDNLY